MSIPAPVPAAPVPARPTSAGPVAAGSVRAGSRRSLPSARELADATGDRDRVVDLLRIVSLLVVIGGHSLMLTVDVSGGRIGLGNLLADLPTLQILTWVLQILPLFFFAGAAAATYGLTRSLGLSRSSRPTSGQWLLTRAQRLLRPLFWYLLVLGTVLTMLHMALAGSAYAEAITDVVARLGVQLLWFLGAYLLVLAVVPMMQRLSSTRSVLTALAACVGAVAIVDLLRLTVGPAELGYLNFLTVWLIPAVLGVAYAKRLLPARIAGALATCALAVDVLLVWWGPYEVSLVTVPGQQLSNMTPPSLLLAGHTIALCAAAIACRRRLATLAAAPRVWWWVAFGNRGAMTLYLWHMPVLALIVVASALLGFDRTGPTQTGFWTVSAAQTLLLLLAMVPVLLLLSPLENTPLRWWDAPRASAAGPWRDAGVLMMLCGTGISLLLLARGGLTADGIGWAALAVITAVTARLISVDAAPAQGVRARPNMRFPGRRSPV